MLFLMRHGPAENTSVTGKDRDRELTASGIRSVRRVIERLKDRAERPSKIVASPFARARDTAKLVAEAYSLTVELDEALEAERDPRDVIEAHLLSGQNVMVVGHDPWFSEVASGYARGPIMMDKGMIVVFEVKEDGEVRERFRIRPT